MQNGFVLAVHLIGGRMQHMGIRRRRRRVEDGILFAAEDGDYRVEERVCKL